MRKSEVAGTEIDFGGVVNALPGLIWTTRADGRSEFVNNGWRDYTGLGPDQSRDFGWQAAIHPEDLNACLETWKIIQQTGADKEIYIRLRRFDGEYRWFTLRPALNRPDVAPEQQWCWLALNADEGPVTDGRLRRLFDMLPVQAAFLNQQGASEFSNRQVLQDYDMTLEQLAAWQTSGAIHADDHPIVYEQLTRLMTTGQMFDATLRMRYKDGGWRWMRSRCVPCRDAQGNIARYVTVQSDVHDLRHAEDLLAAEVKLLELVALGEPLERVLDTLGRSVEALCDGCSCGVLLVASGRKHFRTEAGPTLLHAENGISVDGGDSPWSRAVMEKASVVTSDVNNDPRWENSHWRQVMNGAGFRSCYAVPTLSTSGEATGVVAIYRQISVAPTVQDQALMHRFTKIAGIAIDRAEADAALRSRERELREAYAQLAEGQHLSKTGSFTSDIRQDHHQWSDEFYRIFEIDPDVPPNLEAVRTRIHPDDLQLYDAEVQRGVEGNGADFNFRIITPNAGLKHLRGVAQVMERNADRPIFMGAVQDITESRLADEALNRARTELAHVARVATLNAMTASIAHEVNQPLSGILTNANTCVRMLAADPPNLTGAADTARRTIRDANRAAEVIKRLRAMFSTKAPNPEATDLNEAVYEVIALSTAELRRSGALIRTDFPDGLPLISVDRVQLQQVILNLLLNAADAMAGIVDRPRVLLIQTGLHDGGSVRLAVRDSGIGLDPDVAEKLFQAFYTTKPQGMGVGLSISRSIIESYDGRLWAEANDGPGATFSFSIPIVSAPASASFEDPRDARHHPSC